MGALETKPKEDINTRTLREGFLKLEMEISELEDLMKTKRENFSYGKEDLGGIGKKLEKERLLFREKLVIRLAKEYDEQMDELAEIRTQHHALITSGAMATEFILDSLMRGAEDFSINPRDKGYKRLNKALAESWRTSRNSLSGITMTVEKFKERNTNLNANATAKVLSFWVDIFAKLSMKHVLLLNRREELLELEKRRGRFRGEGKFSDERKALAEVERKLAEYIERINYAKEKIYALKPVGEIV